MSYPFVMRIQTIRRQYVCKCLPKDIMEIEGRADPAYIVPQNTPRTLPFFPSIMPWDIKYFVKYVGASQIGYLIDFYRRHLNVLVGFPRDEKVILLQWFLDPLLLYLTILFQSTKVGTDLAFSKTWKRSFRITLFVMVTPSSNRTRYSNFHTLSEFKISQDDDPFIRVFIFNALL